MSRISEPCENVWSGSPFAASQLCPGLFFQQTVEPSQIRRQRVWISQWNTLRSDLEVKFRAFFVLMWGTKRSQMNLNGIHHTLPTMHCSISLSSAKQRWASVQSIGYRFKSIHWHHIICTSMLLSCGLGNGCDFLFLSSVAEGFHATTSRFSPSASKLHTCSYWIFYKGLFHCDSSNLGPLSTVMSYLPRMSAHFQHISWMQPLIHTPLLTLRSMCSVCCTSCIDLNVINLFVPLNYSFGSLHSSAFLSVLVSKAVTFRTGFSVRS